MVQRGGKSDSNFLNLILKIVSFEWLLKLTMIKAKQATIV